MSKLDVEIYSNLETALEGNKSRFYIVNVSDLNGTATKGNVMINLPSEDGRRINVYLPPTWIPYDLFEYGDRDNIRRSSDLRNLQRDRRIAFITEDSANKLCAAPNYQMEKARVASKGIDDAFLDAKEPTSNKITVNTGVGSGTTGRPNEERSNVAETVHSDVRKLISISETGGHDPVPQEELVSAIKLVFPRLQLSDFEYLTSNLHNRAAFLYLAATDAYGLMSNGETVELENLPCYIDLV